jgi:hypothetical protein
MQRIPKTFLTAAFFVAKPSNMLPHPFKDVGIGGAPVIFSLLKIWHDAKTAACVSRTGG